MKVIFAVFALFVFFATPSCTKTNNITTTIRDTTVVRDTTVIRDTTYQKTHPNPIVGLWVGTYKPVGGPATDSFYYSLDIQAGGSLISVAIANGVSNSSTGSWTLNGVNFAATTTEISTSAATRTIAMLTATYDSVAGQLSGLATFPGSGNPNATYLLNRVP